MNVNLNRCMDKSKIGSSYLLLTISGLLNDYKKVSLGYGNVAPKTFSGRAFCVLFAVLGIPLTLLAIADLGKFLSEIIFDYSDRINTQIKFESLSYHLLFRF